MKRELFCVYFWRCAKILYAPSLHYLVPKSAKAMAKISDCHHMMEFNLSEQFSQAGLILIEAIIIISQPSMIIFLCKFGRLLDTDLYRNKQM